MQVLIFNENFKFTYKLAKLIIYMNKKLTKYAFAFYILNDV